MLLCTDCGSRSVVIETSLREGAAITCAECGQWQGRYPEFFTPLARADEANERPCASSAWSTARGPVALRELTSPLTDPVAG